MGLAIGTLLVLAGLLAFWAWLPAALAFFQGLVVFSLIFWGIIALLVAFSERKAKSEFKASLHDQKSPAEGETLENPASN